MDSNSEALCCRWLNVDILHKIIKFALEHIWKWSSDGQTISDWIVWVLKICAWFHTSNPQDINCIILLQSQSWSITNRIWTWKPKPKGLQAGCTRGHLWTSFKRSVWHVSTHVQTDCGDHKHNKYGGCPHRAQRLDTDRRGIPCSCIVLKLSGTMSVSQLPPVWSRLCRSCVSLKPPLNHE